MEVEHTAVIAVPVDQVWNYVQDMANWAPFVVGYRALRVVDDRTSIWTVRGDVGMLAREVDLRVEVTDWRPGQGVEFTVCALTERLDGSGSVALAPWDPESVEAPADEDATPGPSLRRRSRVASALAKLRRRIARAILRRLDRGRPRSVAPRPVVQPRSASPAPLGDGSAKPTCTGGTRLSFQLSLSPGGPMAPMFELLMAPLLEPAAEDLTAAIRGVLER
jgi:carbon monoxide dehydrogenase subunit G